MKKLLGNKKLSLLIGVLLATSLTNNSYADNSIQTKHFRGKEISKNIVQEGWGNSSDTVIILNGKAPIDGILATPLSGVYNAPVLLTSKDSVPKETKDELVRIKPKNLIIVGGEGIVSKTVERTLQSTLKNIKIDRIGGIDRYETSLLVAKRIDSKYKVDNVYFGYGSSEADLISIASKAGEEKRPIILTQKDVVPKATYDWIANKKLANAYFIGGEAVISNNVIKSINKLTNNDVTANRVWGQDRFETNGKVIEKFYSNKELNSVLVTNAYDYETSLIATPLAIKFKSPLLLVDNNNLNDVQSNIINKKRTRKIYRLGDRVNENIFNNVANSLKYNPLIDANNGSKDVLFFVPHQDDEVLSFATVIKKYLDNEFNVNVVLMTDGSAVGLESLLNGEKPCKIHQRTHNPKAEGYKQEGINIDSVNNERIVKYRNEEYVRALMKLGLSKEQIHFSSFIQRDLYVDKDIAIQGMMEYLSMYPNATVHTFYNTQFSKNNHIDHMRLGIAAKELYDNKKIHKLYLHVEPYWYSDFIKVNTNTNVYAQYANTKNEKNSVVNAAKEYSIWEPQNGKLAVGNHSVKKLLDNFMANPVNYFVEVK